MIHPSLAKKKKIHNSSHESSKVEKDESDLYRKGWIWLGEADW